MTFFASFPGLLFLRNGLFLLLAMSISSSLSIGEDTSVKPEGEEAPFSVIVRPDSTTEVRYRAEISGTLATPTQSDPKKWDLKSVAGYHFIQRQLRSDEPGPRALTAVRHYLSAESKTNVGDDHTVKTQLPDSLCLTQVKGTDSGLNCASVQASLDRSQFDLLQMPFDPLFVSGLLPGREVAVGDKWNSDSWVIPCLVGMEATTGHEVSCELVRLEGDLAHITVKGKSEGAMLGSSSSIEFEGQFVFDHDRRMLTSLNCTMTEQRTPGPVHPGVDAKVEITWEQSETSDSRAPDSVRLPEEIDVKRFEQPLTLTTPWRLRLTHGRDWYLFNQTDQVVMLRQMKNGALLSQCNISAGAVVAPGSHTPDEDFRQDVMRAIEARDGKILKEETIREDGSWRIRHLQARTTAAGGVEIIQDHYLCSAAEGDQFSLMFSHSVSDDQAFGDEPTRFLDSLSAAPRRPALPFR